MYDCKTPVAGINVVMFLQTTEHFMFLWVQFLIDNAVLTA